MTGAGADSAPLYFDAMINSWPDPAQAAVGLEHIGLDAALVTETSHDPFVALVLAAQATERIRLGTSIAVAFARSPMTMAVVANHVQQVSEGRLVLGLGTQVKPHITRRFSMPWSRPVDRMREYVRALRAIWASWELGTPLDFRGDFYEHTLMAPLFDPGPNPWGPPPVYLSGVGRDMTVMAGEVADGFLAAPLATVRFIDEMVKPALAQGRASVGAPQQSLEVCAMPFIATGRDQAEMDRSVAETRARIAFYASTANYAVVLELHGLGGLAEELTVLSREKRWEEMTRLVDDDVLELFTVIAPPADLRRHVARRYAGLVDRVTLYSVADLNPLTWQQVFAH